MEYVPVDTACSILADGLGVVVSGEYLDSLVSDGNIHIYVCVRDGLAKPMGSVNKPTSKSGEDITKHISQFVYVKGMEKNYIADDLIEVSPKVFKCCKDRSITESVDFYTQNELFTAYETDGVVYSLVSFEKAYWVFSEKELQNYLDDKKQKIIIPLPASKEMPNKEFWKALKEELQSIGGFLCEVAKAYCGEHINLPDYDDMLIWLDKNTDHEYLNKYDIKIDLMKSEITVQDEKNPLKPNMYNNWNRLVKKSKKIKKELSL